MVVSPHLYQGRRYRDTGIGADGDDDYDNNDDDDDDDDDDGGGDASADADDGDDDVENKDNGDKIDQNDDANLRTPGKKYETQIVTKHERARAPHIN